LFLGVSALRLEYTAFSTGSPGVDNKFCDHVPTILLITSIKPLPNIRILLSGIDYFRPKALLASSNPARHPAHPAQTVPRAAPHRQSRRSGGRGNILHPGEISLAHRGVLFLEEFPEFGNRVLEVIRQPMEDKVVTISRAKGSLTFPANFQLIAAMNPCPCGYYGDAQKPCTCNHSVVTKYQKRISGPMLDRIDIHTYPAFLSGIEVPRVDYEKLSSDRLAEALQYRPKGVVG
jgi:predicted ATPase with chaperone activity